MKITLYLIKIHFIIIYFFIKIFTRQKKQVCLLSRQSDSPSINYKMIISELRKNKIIYKIKCKKIEKNINDGIRSNRNQLDGQFFLIKALENIKEIVEYYFCLWQQMVFIAQSKVIITDGYNLPVCLLHHKKGTKIIQMWHALGAIKKFGYQSVGKTDGVSPTVAKILKMHAGYDYVISGSYEMNKYFSEAFNIEKEKVLAIATPIVDYLHKENTRVKQSIYKKYPQLQEGKINVLYSPTFRNNKNYKYEEIIKNTDFSKINLIITNHAKVEELANDKRVISITSNEFSTYDIIKICDYVITDYSSLMIDAISINKKILLYIYDYEEYDERNGINIRLLEEFPKISYKKADEIMNIITNNKYDYQSFKKFKRLYAPSIEKSSTKLNIDLIKRCLDE